MSSSRANVQRKQSLALFCKSARLQEKRRLRRQVEGQMETHQLPSPTSITPGEEPSHDPLAPARPSNLDQKRKRAQFEGVLLRKDNKDHKQKRQRSSSANSADGGSPNSELLKYANPVEFWRKTYTWPQEYFERDPKMSQPLVRKRSSSVRSLELQSSQGTSNDLPREAKSAPYKDARYETYLATARAFMDNPPLKVTDACKDLCRRLLNKEQSVPENSLFRDDLFEITCSKIRNENEARVIKDIAWLIVASAENLATYGATELDILIEKVNSSWLKCLPLTSARPQPDYSVGFRASAFTKDQLNKLSPFVGGYKDQCSVMAREDMYFPFLTTEVKCGEQALNIADRQNMHSASVSVKGIVELFRRIKRQNELDRKILAFSISHDNEAVRIYGHYALVNENDTSLYRYPIKKFDFTSEDGTDKWTAYKFTRNVYDTFVPIHLKRICAAVDQLPGPEVFLVEPFSQQSNAEYMEQDTPRFPLSESSEPVFKRPQRKGAKG
ncbi:MAG: hypothetical protein Q9217_001316 [Psora testacea]